MNDVKCAGRRNTRKAIVNGETHMLCGRCSLEAIGFGAIDSPGLPS